jgi:hypothetical protein
VFGDTAPGEAHGKQNPFRWDTSSSTVVLALLALGFLVFVKWNVGASAHIGAGR